MKGKSPTLGLISALASLITSIFYGFLAATINESRRPTVAPDWIHIARVLAVALAICCLIFPYFVEQQLRVRHMENLRSQGKEPELMVLICGFAFLLFPPCVAIILFFFGNPVTDVYLYAAFSLVMVLVWSWHQRAFLRMAFEGASDVTPPLSLPSKPFPSRKRAVSILRSYTIILLLLSGLALIFLAVEITLVVRPPPQIITPVFPDILSISFYTFLATACFITALLRIKNSSSARMATAVTSFILLAWIPFGPAAFIYWIGWVHKKERKSLEDDR